MYKNRYRRILWFFGRVLLTVIWWDILLPYLGLRRLSNSSRPVRMKKIASTFRRLAVDMGGVMIKVGQFLSARLDVLPREITDELAGLQDEVKPESFDAIREVIEKELGGTLGTIFDWFDPVPLAAASIGQVHKARLCETDDVDDIPCRDVVIKVQRPNIEQIVEVDLQALQVVGGWLERYPPVRKHANVPALLSEFSRSLREEIDYLQEGQNAETFAANFAGRIEISVPLVYWSHTTRRVLTLEDMKAIKITDYAAIEEAGIDRSEVAARLFDAYLQQIFDDRFFHADPHPGNLFVVAQDPGNGETEPNVSWKLIFIDFGMTGHITPSILKGLQEGLIAAATQDSERLVKAYQILGVLLPGADLELIKRASSVMFQKVWGKTTPELMKMRHEDAVAFAEEFSDLVYDMPFQFPEDLILLGRCLAILNGICTGLDPNFNVWVSVAPYASKLIEDEQGSRLNFLIKEGTDALRLVAGLPRRVDNLLSRIETGRLEIRTPDLKLQLSRLERTQRRLFGAVIFSGLLLGAIQLYLGGSSLFAGVLSLIAIVILIWTTFIR